MKLLPVLALALAAVLLPAAPALSQENAGRVILATGNVAVVRGAQRIPATVGVPLRAGDTLEVGEQSHAQLHLTDDSIISLRPGTTFRLTEYAFDGKNPEEGRSFFNLVKGGMRTVTGLIRSRDRYRVSTETVSIGIRGTHYWLVSCNQDCRNKDGTLAADGDYGLVREGKVAIGARDKLAESVFGSEQIMHVQAPAPGTVPGREFGSDQVFHVARATGTTSELIGPPPFLFVPVGGVQPPKPAAPAVDAAGKPKVAPDKPAPAVAAAAPVPVAPTGQHGGTGDSRFTSTVVNNTALTFANVTQQTVTVGSVANSSPVLQAAALQSATTALAENSFAGTAFYRLAGPSLNIPVTTCSSPPCDTARRGQISLAVNFALQRATIRVDLAFGPGDFINFSTPSATSGIPITINGNQATFSGTLNRADFPENNGAFRCSQCGPVSPSFPNGSPGFANQLSFSGTITGSQATVTLSAVDSGGGGSLTATLPAVSSLPNNTVAAMAIQRQDGGTDARAASFFNVQVDSAGRLLQFGPNDGVSSFGNHVGGPSARVGTATNTIVGSAPSAGNLVWGAWTGPGAQVIDSNYDAYTTTSSGRLSVQPWITGEASNNLPPSLGVLTYSPIGSVFTNSSQVLNGASLTANFMTRTLSITIDATNNSGGNRFVMNGSTGFSPASGQFSSGFSTVTCTGPCNSPSNFRTADGSFGGFFAGQQAQGAGVIFSAGFGAQAVSGTAGNGVTGAIGMKR